MSRFVRIRPEGDDRERLSCPDCGYVEYENPKVVVGSVVEHDGRVLLCRRAIEPRRGFWTLPAGYLELGETAAEGAVRECLEEATARIVVDGILAVFDVSRIGQVHILYRGRFADPGRDLRRGRERGGRAVRLGRDPVVRHRLPDRRLGAGGLARAG